MSSITQSSKFRDQHCQNLGLLEVKLRHFCNFWSLVKNKSWTFWRPNGQNPINWCFGNAEFIYISFNEDFGWSLTSSGSFNGILGYHKFWLTNMMVIIYVFMITLKVCIPFVDSAMEWALITANLSHRLRFFVKGFTKFKTELSVGSLFDNIHVCTGTTNTVI